MMESTIQIHSSGWEAIGLVVYLLLLLLFFTLAVGFVLIAKYRLLWNRRKRIYYAGCLISLFLLMTVRLLPSFLEFNSISIRENGTWIFRNGLGIKLGEISEKNPRKIDVTRSQTIYYGVNYSSTESDYLFITSEKKKFFSVRGLSNSIQMVSEKLHQGQLSQNIPISQSQADHRPKILKYLHISTSLLFAFSLLSPLLFFRSRKN